MEVIELNIINYIKDKFSRKYTNEISYDEAMRIVKENKNVYLIDVRSKQEFEEGHLKNAISMPVYDLTKTIIREIPLRDSLIIVYCQKGIRSKKSARILADLCYTNVFEIKGGVNLSKLCF